MQAIRGKFSGKTCVITGAASGIGRATACAFAAEGARLALLDRDEAGLAATCASIAARGAEVIALPCDVADETAIQAAGDETGSRFGPADILINSAGLLRSGPLATLSLADWNLLVSVNLTGFFLCARTFALQMRKNGGGAMVHLSSIGGTHATANAGAYSVTKAAVIMLSRQLAIELGSEGIRSNVVSPGLIRTPMTEAFYAKPGAEAARKTVVPAGRIGVPDDIARAIMFLCSPEADYISGQELNVDGGLSRMLLSFVPRDGFDRKEGA